jgi:beta-galactosidase
MTQPQRAATPSRAARATVILLGIALSLLSAATPFASAGKQGGVHVSGVALAPSTRRKSLGIRIEVTGRLPAGTVEVTARLLDEGGREERAFTGQVPCIAADSQTLNIGFPWPNPRLWDLDRPNLYTLVLAVKGPDLDEQVRREFGFREFWVEGRRLFLNGVPIRLRPDAGTDIEAERAAGFNFSAPPASLPAGGSAPPEDEAWFARADRAGWPTAASLPSMVPYVFDRDGRFVWDEARREAWTRDVEREIRRLANHPSILVWTHSPGLLANPQDQNPRLFGRTDSAVRAGAAGAYQAALEGCAIVRRLDPTRPVTTLGGADAGDIYTARTELNFLPLQEREDWLAEWAKGGDMPAMALGFGTPLPAAFLRGRMDYERALATEPLLTEYAAIYLGHQAYADETEAYRSSYAGRFERDQTYRLDPARDLDPMIEAPAFQKIEALFAQNSWRSWRTAGITGGMAPSGSGRGTAGHLTESGRALAANDGATLAWITGPWDAPTAKTHSYHVDETVEKRLALINDTRAVQPFRYEWRAFIHGSLLASGRGQGRMWPAQTLFRPLRFATPFFRSGKMDGEIVLSATIGAAAHEDRFVYRVFARRQRRDRPPSLAIFDPNGKTGDILPVVDYIPRPWRGERNVPLVVVGQNALSSGARIPGDLEAYVRGGGRLLLFSQRAEWIEKTLGMRTSPHLARRVFPVSEAHPLMRGLDALDLRDWRGSSNVVPARPVYAGDTPAEGWHWGNRGVVSSVSIEKPHMSSWRPLLEDEFDLAYTPLMEMDYGRGRVIWCTLDLADHAITDAAAERVFGRVLDYALHAPLTPKAERVVYVGDRAGASYLAGLGVEFRDAGTDRADAALLAGPASPQLLLVGGTATIAPGDLGEYLRRGGKVLFLARGQSEPGASPTLVTASRHGAADAPSWAECRGIGVSDMHWRADVDVPVLQSLPDVEAAGVHGQSSIAADGLLGRIKLGKGAALFCQIAPDRLDADAKTYLRLTRWRQTHALCQILSNMGASFRQDARLFQRPGAADGPGFYHPDYRTDFALGDDPYRYYRW